MGSAFLLGAGTIRPTDIAGAILVAAGAADGGRGPTTTEEALEEGTAAAPQLSRTRTGAPRA